MLFNIVLAVQVITAIGIIFLVMLQHGKGADAGPALSGGAQSLFGSSGGGNTLTRLTSILAVIFVSACLTLVALTGESNRQLDSVVTRTPVEKQDVSIPKPE